MRHATTAFSAGETSDLLDDRSELTQVSRSLRELKNAELLRFGSLDKRAGTEYLGEAGNNDDVRLEAFEFSAFTKFQLEFGAGYIRFWSNDTQVTSSGIILEVTTPYLATELHELQFRIVGDFVFIVHANHYPRLLKRVADDNWTIEEADFAGPYIDGDEDIVMSITGKTGEQTLTASEDYFLDSMVGEDIQLVFRQEAFSDSLSASDSTAIDVVGGLASQSFGIGDAVNYEPNKTYFRCIKAWTPARYAGTPDPADYPDYWEAGEILFGPRLIAGKWDFSSSGDWIGRWVVQTSEDGEEWTNKLTFTSVDDASTPQFQGGDTEDAPVYLRILLIEASAGATEKVLLEVEEAEAAGTMTIDSKTTSRIAVVTIDTELVGEGEAVSYNRQAWSASLGYPRAVGFNELRLIFTGSTDYPVRVWYSEVDNFFNYIGGTLATSPMVIDAVGEDYSPVQWIATRDEVFVGTASNEGSLIPRDDRVTVSAENLPRSSWFSSEGSAYLPAVFLNSSFFALQAGEETIHEFKYSIEVDRYDPEEATLLHDYILSSGVRQMVVRREPEKGLICVKKDGTVVVYTHKPSASMAGWWRLETDGEILSCCVTRGDGDEDEVYFAVLRDGVIYIERQSMGLRTARRNGEQASLNYLDNATILTGSTLAEVSGLTRFASKEVTYLVDGAEFTGTVSAAGVLTLEQEGSTVIVGLPFETLITPHNIEAFSKNSNSMSRKKQINEVVVSYWNSIGGEVRTTNGEWYPLRMPSLDDVDPEGGATHSMQTGMRKIPLDQRTGRKQNLEFRHTEATPFTLLGLYAEVEVMQG